MTTSSNLNLATQTRWLGVIPFKQLLPEYGLESSDFNLSNFSMPSVELGASPVTYSGYTYEIPNGTRTQSKEVVFEYMVSADWKQYMALYDWSCIISDEEEGGTDVVLAKACVPVRVYILSEFNVPIFSFVYHNAWIKTFGEISLDYQDDGATEIKHTFTMGYSHYTMEKARPVQ